MLFYLVTSILSLTMKILFIIFYVHSSIVLKQACRGDTHTRRACVQGSEQTHTSINSLQKHIKRTICKRSNSKSKILRPTNISELTRNMTP
jgi:hypothetical protein